MKIRSTQSRSILSRTTGYIAEAGFTHSLTPARNCTYGCVYCYVPTLRVFGGLKREDWEHWGQFTTFKENAPELVRRELRPDQRIYCSPLVDPYQPAEQSQQMMPAILAAVRESPPTAFTIQTRGTLVERDLSLLQELSKRTRLRVSFSITTDDDRVRRLYEPLCEPIPARLATVRRLRDAGIDVFATLAPLLPCDPEQLAALVVEATSNNIICDALHIREKKASGATTREQAWRVADHHGHREWFESPFQTKIVERIRRAVEAQGRRFAAGPEGFSWLAQI